MVLQLEYVQLMHRHGERTPLFFGEHDTTDWNFCHKTSTIGYTAPAIESTGIWKKIKELFSGRSTLAPIQFRLSLESGHSFNCAPGQLTDKGRETLIDLGKWFRKRYIEKEKLVSPVFKKEEFLLRSTNFQRTLESLQSLMQGMYPTHPAVMDVKVHDLTTDILACNRNCPRLKKMYVESKEQLKKEFARKAEKINKYFSNNYSPQLGSLSLYAIYDLVTSSNAHGYRKFGSIPKDIMKYLEEYSLKIWFGHLNSTEGLALNTGCLLKELSSQMIQKVTDPSYKAKVSVFSTHDVIIYPLLMAMGVHTDKWPKFGANIIFELVKDTDTNTRYVGMRYNGAHTPILKCNTQKKMKGYCTLDEFVSVCNSIYKENFTEACLKSA